MNRSYIRTFILLPLLILAQEGCAPRTQQQNPVNSNTASVDHQQQETVSQPYERVIFDTDVGGDVDDAGALAVLHALADRGEIELLAMGVVIGHEAAVPFVHAVNTWYGQYLVRTPGAANRYN